MGLRKLRIGGFKNYAPQVDFSNCRVWSLKHCTHPGSDAELLQIVLQLANIDYELVQQDYNTDELLHHIENGTLDMSNMALRMTEDRFDRILYTTPINFLKYGYVIKEIGKLESDDFLLNTFRPEIFLLIIASLLLTAFVIRLICASDHGFLTWCWRLFVVFFNQDRFFYKPSLTTIFLGGSWILFAFLTVTYYQSKMKGFLAVPLHRSVPFFTTAEMLDAVENDGYTAFTLPTGYDPSSYCQPEECERVERIRREGRIVYHSEAGINNDSYILTTVHEKLFTFIGLTAYQSFHDVSIYDSKNGLLFVGDKGVYQELLAFALNRKFKEEREAINRALALTQNAYSRIRNYYNSPLRPYSKFANCGPITISLIHLFNFFIVFGGLTVVTLTIFALELMSYKFQWRHYTLQTDSSTGSESLTLSSTVSSFRSSLNSLSPSSNLSCR